MFRLLAGAFVAAAVLFPSLGHADSDALPVNPALRMGRLPNGLTYYIHKNGQPAKKLELRLIVKAGSAQEDDDQQGLAHFLEHMAFNGTIHFKQQQLVSYLESIGVKMGADLNAYTSFTETVYMLPVPTGNPEHVAKGLLMLRDIAGGITLNPQDIDAERGIVLEEIRLRKGAAGRIQRAILPKMFNGSRYAQRLPEGKEEVIKSFKPELLKRFYKEWYRPELMAVVAVGDLQPAEIEARIAAQFSDLRNPSQPRQRLVPAIAPINASDALAATDKEASGNQIQIRFPPHASEAAHTPAQYRARLFQPLFLAMMNQRFRDPMRRDKGYLSALGLVDHLPSGQRAMVLTAVLEKSGAEPGIDALVKEASRINQFGFRANELELAKNGLLRELERAGGEEDKTSSAAYAQQYVRRFAGTGHLMGPQAEYLLAKEMVPGISIDEVNQYARLLLPRSAPKLLLYTGAANAETTAPTREQMLENLTYAEQLIVKPAPDTLLVPKLLAQLPRPGAIVEQQRDEALGFTRIKLSNGLVVILKPTNFRNEQILMTASRHGGQSRFGDADHLNARHAHEAVGSMGIQGHPAWDVHKIMAGKTARVTTGMDLYRDFVNGASDPADLEMLFQLLHLRFTGVPSHAPSFDAYVTQLGSLSRNTMAQPDALLADAIQATLYGNHPRAPRATRPNDLSTLSMSRMTAIYKERFDSAHGMTFIFVGRFDMETIKPLITTYLASLPSHDVRPGYRDIGLMPVHGIVKRELRSGSDPKSTVALTFSGPAEYDETEDMRLRALADIIQLRINATLREKLALIYSGHVGGEIMRGPKPVYLLEMKLPTGPEKTDAVLKAAFGEMRSLRDHGPTEAELNKVRQNWLQRRQHALGDNAFWLNQLELAARHGSFPDGIRSFDRRVAALRTADIQQAARRYLDLNNYVQVILNPGKQ